MKFSTPLKSIGRIKEGFLQQFLKKRSKTFYVIVYFRYSMLVQWHFCKFHHLLPEKPACTEKFLWLASLWLYGEEKDSATPVVRTVRRSSAPRSQIMQGQSGSSDQKHGSMSTSELATTQPPPGLALAAVMAWDWD